MNGTVKKFIQTVYSLIFVALFLYGFYLTMTIPAKIYGGYDTVAAAAFFISGIPKLIKGMVFLLVGGLGLIINYYHRENHHIVHIVCSVLSLLFGLMLWYFIKDGKIEMPADTMYLLMDDYALGFIAFYAQEIVYTMLGSIYVFLGGLGLLVHYHIWMRAND